MIMLSHFIGFTPFYSRRVKKTKANEGKLIIINGEIIYSLSLLCRYSIVVHDTCCFSYSFFSSPNGGIPS